MIISSNKIRPIYPQQEINWQKTCSAINVDGYYNFYFSGQTGNDLIFKLKNNKIYSYNDDLLGGFNKNEIISFSGNIANQKLDLYKDSNPLYLGLKRQASGNILGFSVECENTNFNVETLLINGSQPDYYFDSNITYNSGEQIPVYIRNSGIYPIIVYSGALANTNYYSISGANNLTIPPLGTSNFYLINNGVFSNNLEVVNVNLFTNLGTESLYISLSGTLIDNTLFYIVLSPPVNTIFDTNRFIYTLTLANASGSDLSVALEYVSGFTGKYYAPIQRSNFITGRTVSGIISGSGFLYGNGTGLVSGFNNILNQFEFATGSGLMSFFRVANDQYIERTYNVPGSGIGDVFLLTGIPGTGYGQIVYSGYITYLGGTLTGFGYGNISGIVPDKKVSWVPMGDGTLGPAPINEDILDVICRLQPENCAEVRASNFRYQYASGTGFGVSFYNYEYTGIITGYYPSGDLTTVDLNKADVYVTGKFIDMFAVTGIVYATGGRKTGVFLGDILDFFEPGNWEVWKMWGGILSGKSAVVEWTGDQFNPITNTWSASGVTGYFIGKISGTGGVSICDLEFPELIPSGIPNAVRLFDFEKGFTPPNKMTVFYRQVTGDVIAPRNIGFKYLEWPNENSNFVIKSGTTSLHSLHPTGGRTRISRLGNTPSGSGRFDNVFQFPFYEGINEPRYYTGSGGDLLLISGNVVPLYKYKLNATGGKIPLYNGYKCQYLTGLNGTLIRKPLVCSNGSIDCIDGICENGICYDILKNSNGENVYDQDGQPVINRLSYQCEPLRDNFNNIILQPLIDVSGSIYVQSGSKVVKAFTLPWANTGIKTEMYLMEREMFVVSSGFFGWLEQIPVLTGRRYFEDYASSITGISGMGMMVNSCDYTYINFNVNGSGSQTVDFDFVADPENLLIFQLYKSGTSNPLINISGGYYVTNPMHLKANSLCDSGQYFGVLKFIPEVCFMDTGINIGTCLAFSHTTFTGCESNGYLAGKILRKGYAEFQLGLHVVGYFTGPRYKYLSSGVKASGIRWNVILEPGQTEAKFSFPIYPHSSLDQDVFGKFHFNIFSGIDNYPFPINTLGIEDQDANFVIQDMSGICSASVGGEGVQPINNYEVYNTQLGLDFDRPPQTPTLISWPFDCNP